MKISTKGRYALRLMIDLALQDPHKYTALKDVSARQRVSIKYLEQITTRLCKVGYLKSARGPQGGDILRITEGSLAPVTCLDTDPAVCGNYAQCPTLVFWKGLQTAIDDYVDSVTLADLLPACQINGDDYII